MIRCLYSARRVMSAEYVEDHTKTNQGRDHGGSCETLYD